MRRLRRRELPVDHPTALAFLDESGSIAQDRFFAVGCLKLEEPSRVLRAVQKLRDQAHRYHEIHFNAVTRKAVPFYERVVDLIANQAGSFFSCFVADRQVADPVVRFKTPWRAYEKLATQLLLGSIRPWEIVTVIADNYSTPPGVDFERDVKLAVNKRLGRLAVACVCRLDSKAADPLQLVDLLTSAVAFEFREAAGLASARSPKARVAGHLRARYGIQTALHGCRVSNLNVAIYQEK
jgi:hypothetical protein